MKKHERNDSAMGFNPRISLSRCRKVCFLGLNSGGALCLKLMDTAGQSAVIKVIGIGGGGGNAVDHMLSASLEGVEFVNANTDAQALHRSGVSKVVQLGENPDQGTRCRV